jgi:heptaprenyl diphosphate synthase
MVSSLDGANGGDWLTHPQVISSLGRMVAVLREEVSCDDPQLRVMTDYLIARSGKRLRPALLFLAATYGDYKETLLLRAAAALELLHTASLYHDDVMDRAPLRRGEPSVNVRWGNASATLAGTFLFARATKLMSSLGALPNQLASNASCALCTGQLKEVENAYNQDLSEADHLDILQRKTGTLFELPCRLGAVLSQAATAVSDALADYGRRLGLAFQLADDALDLIGEASRLGKATGTDLREGIYSLPVLWALRQQSSQGEWLRQRLRQAHLSAAEEREVITCLRASGGVEAALALARSEAESAKQALAALPDGPARLALSRLADFSVTRAAEGID